MATAHMEPAPHANLAQSRYTDIKGEPVGKMLTPIAGYQNEPDLPLEDAVSSITHLFIDLEQNVWIAKFNCENPQDGLTQDESAAIHIYTMQFSSGDSLYITLNRTLRTEQREFLIPWFKYLKLFITALFKLESVRATVWRGVRGEDLSGKYPTGRKFAWWGVSSCTTTPDVFKTSNFLGKTGTRTLFSIECLNGKSIKKHSYFSDMEQEVILTPGTFFEVIGQIEPAEGLHIIHLKEIQPPFPLIKPPFSAEKFNQTQHKQSGGSTHGVSSGVLPKPVAPPTAPKTAPQSDISLNLIRLKNKPRLSMEVNIDIAVMFANDQYLLYPTPGHLNLLNVNGQELFTVKHDSSARDICWSSYLNRFLILFYNKTFHLLDVQSRSMKNIIEFSRDMLNCSCFESTLLVCSDPPEVVIEVYDMAHNYKRINVFQSPLSCEKNHRISSIRFNASGSRLGVIVGDSKSKQSFFQLRNPNDMHILTTVDLIISGWGSYRLLSLPKDEFLMCEYTGKELFLIDRNGQLKDTIEPYEADKKISALAFIQDDKCLVRLTGLPYQLHFYDL